jgi:hypothetical protein
LLKTAARIDQIPQPLPALSDDADLRTWRAQPA